MRVAPNRVIEDRQVAAFLVETSCLGLRDVLVPHDFPPRDDLEVAGFLKCVGQRALVPTIDHLKAFMDVASAIGESEDANLKSSHDIIPIRQFETLRPLTAAERTLRRAPEFFQRIQAKR